MRLLQPKFSRVLYRNDALGIVDKAGHHVQQCCLAAACTAGDQNIHPAGDQPLEYRRHIGLVLQEPFLFFGTIAENIAYGKPEATREEIIAAARAAHAHEFILRLPQGYDSLVGERGQGLSGGERQRISIARALLIDPRILILDEATASVDSETEKEIQKALDNLVQGRTTIAIAHRLSTLQRADRLVVLDKGQVVEEGTHDVLMARHGAYYNLYKAQARNMDVDLDDVAERRILKQEAKEKT